MSRAEGVLSKFTGSALALVLLIGLTACGGPPNWVKKGSGAFIVAGGDASELLESGEEILDQMSGCIHFLIICAPLFAVVPRRYDGLHARLFQQVKDAFLRVIGLVGQKRLNVCQKIG